jgi:hypothetical protein
MAASYAEKGESVNFKRRRHGVVARHFGHFYPSPLDRRQRTEYAADAVPLRS